MKLIHLAKLLDEQEAPSEPTAPPAETTPARDGCTSCASDLFSATTSSKIAKFNTPLFSRPIKRKKRKMLKESLYLTSDDYENSLLDTISRKFSRRSLAFGFLLEKVNPKELDVKCPTGRVYSIYKYESWIVVSQKGLKLKVDEKGRLLGDEDSFMAWPLPGNEMIPCLHTNETLAEEITFVGGNWVIKRECFMAYPAFVDLSDDKSVIEEEQLEKISKWFVPLTQEQYGGAFDNITVYADRFGPKKSGRNRDFDPPKETLPASKTKLVSVWDVPENQWDKTMTEYDWGKVGPRVAEMTCKGEKGELDSGMVYWPNSKLRYLPSVASVDWLQREIETPEGSLWISVHCVPKVPWHYFETMLDELKKVLEAGDFPDSIPTSQQRFDMVRFLAVLWTYLDDDFYTMGGIIYRKNNVWGILTYQNAQGTGVPRAATSISRYFNYYFLVRPDGLIQVATDSMDAHDGNMTPGESDIVTFFHPKTGEDTAADLINRFVFGS